MPLRRGYSKQVVSDNIAEMIDGGYAPDRAEAAALNTARKEYFKRYPNGRLPLHLKLPGGKVTRRAFQQYLRKSNPAVGQKFIDDAAVFLLKVQRKDGWKAVSEKINELVLRANLSIEDEMRLRDALHKISTKHDPYEFVEYARGERNKNPVPPSKHSTARSRGARIKKAARLYTEFTGHDADEYVEVDKPLMPDVMLVVGDVDGILYTTVRDGKEESYIHEFTKKCRPLFCVTPDGKAMFILGGSYEFTERGIVDRT